MQIFLVMAVLSATRDEQADVEVKYAGPNEREAKDIYNELCDDCEADEITARLTFEVWEDGKRNLDASEEHFPNGD